MYHPRIYHTCEYEVFILKNVGVDPSPNFVGSMILLLLLLLEKPVLIWLFSHTTLKVSNRYI